MTRFLLLLFTLTLFMPCAMAEPKDEPTAEMLKELREFKIKYLIQKIDLPADKQAEFTKVYTQYENEKAALFRDLHQRFKSMRKNLNPSEAEYMVTAESMATAKSREGELEKQYFNKFKTILSAKQLYLMKKAEQKFDRKLGEMHRKNGAKTKTRK